MVLIITILMETLVQRQISDSSQWMCVIFVAKTYIMATGWLKNSKAVAIISPSTGVMYKGI
ncbi:MAG: hypothetical protein ACLVB1_03685 [Blautia obeum]